MSSMGNRSAFNESDSCETRSSMNPEWSNTLHRIYRANAALKLYSQAILKIVGWLDKAATVTENDQQKDVINSLIEFYKTGSLKTYDDYSIKWVKDVASLVDFVVLIGLLSKPFNLISDIII